jgi:hypothetical protein
MVSLVGYYRNRGDSYDDAAKQLHERWEKCEQPPDAPYPMTWD